MDQKKFNKEMDSYIRSQRKKQKEHGGVSFNVEAGSSGDVPEVKEDGITVEYQEEGFIDKVIDFFTGTEPEPAQPETREELSPQEKKQLADMEETEVDEPEEEVMVEESDDYEELEVPEPGFLEKLAMFFGFGEDYEMDEMDEYAEMSEMEDFNPEEYAEEESERLMLEEDVKDVLKIMHDWIEELPADKKKEFKQSEDFEKYKNLLDKMDLLK